MNVLDNDKLNTVNINPALDRLAAILAPFAALAAELTKAVASINAGEVLEISVHLGPLKGDA